MELLQAIKERHSVRSFTDKAIEEETAGELRSLIGDCNRESGLNIQLCLNEPTAFTGIMARYGKFNNVKSYIALVGKSVANLEELCGYYGEKIVLRAQQIGLNTCWVAASFSKGKSKKAIKIDAGEKLLMVIALGYGETKGVPHNTKAIESLCEVNGAMPDWFRKGMEAVQLAPTAMNQQKFKFVLNGDDRVKATPGSGFYTRTDMGIAKYHFEVGAENQKIKWD